MRTVLFFLFVLLTNLSKGQFQFNQLSAPLSYIPNTKTNIEQFINSPGSIIKNEISILFKQNNLGMLGAASNFDFLKIVSTDLKNGKKINGILINCFINRDYHSPGLYAYIDEDEIKGITDYLNFIIEKYNSTEKNKIEYLYKTKNIQFNLTNTGVEWDYSNPIRITDWKFIFSLGNSNEFVFDGYNSKRIVKLRDELVNLKF